LFLTINVKAKIEKCLEDNLGANLLDFRVGKEFLGNKKLLEVVDKFIILKLKIAFQKTSLRK